MAETTSLKGLSFEPPFTSAQVCEILNGCAASGVRSFSYRGLIVQFGLDFPTIHQNIVPEGEASPRTDDPNELAIEEQRVKRALLEQLRLTDPEGYEDLVTDGELMPAEEENALEESN